MKKVYIAGKVSDEDFNEVAQKFAAAHCEIDKLGFIPIFHFSKFGLKVLCENLK